MSNDKWTSVDIDEFEFEGTEFESVKVIGPHEKYDIRAVLSEDGCLELWVSQPQSKE